MCRLFARGQHNGRPKQIANQIQGRAGILAAVALLAAFYLLVPMGQSNAELYKELDQTRNDFKSKEAQVKPLRGLPEKLRSEEHTSELQSPMYLVCRLLLEKKKANARRRWRSRPSTQPAVTRAWLT